MCRILMIDDDVDFLKVSKSLLYTKGFDVMSTTNCDEVESIVNEYRPQIILLDVFLAGIDGLEICKKLKSSPLTSEIPIIIISGYPKSGERAVYEFGADAFICKPFEITELVNHIHDILSGNHIMC